MSPRAQRKGDGGEVRLTRMDPVLDYLVAPLPRCYIEPTPKERKRGSIRGEWSGGIGLPLPPLRMVDEFDKVAVGVSEVGVEVSVVIPDSRRAIAVKWDLYCREMGHHPLPIGNFQGKVIGLKIGWFWC